MVHIDIYITQLYNMSVVIKKGPKKNRKNVKIDIQSEVTKEPDNTIAKKKKPGRPRKTPIRQPQEKKGIVQEPNHERNHIEFMYDNPEMFKKILYYFKSHAVYSVFITFTKTDVLIWCGDNLKKNRIRVKIDCKMINQYYCFEPLDIRISCEHLERIMATIDKTYNLLTIISQKDNVQNYLEIILKDDIMSRSFKVELMSDHNVFRAINHLFDEDFKYSLCLNMSSKKFKSLIGDMLVFSDEVSIELHSQNDPLIFQYRSRDNKIKNTSTCRENLYTLNKEIEDGDTFHISFKLEYVRSISSSLISENIKIFADEDRCLLFVNEIDGGCISVRTLTEIIDKRKEIDLGAI